MGELTVIIKEIVVFILIVCKICWGMKAGTLTPYVRNIISLGAMAVAGIFFLLQWKYRVINFWLILFVAGVFLFAEKCPKNPQTHNRRREYVTSLQDLLFFTAMFFILICIYEF